MIKLSSAMWLSSKRLLKILFIFCYYERLVSMYVLGDYGDFILTKALQIFCVVVLSFYEVMERSR